MSCGSCNCNPCSCDVCDPNNEPLASALNNFITAFYGTVTKTCVNDEVQWILPCDLEEGLPGSLARREGEGVACYLLRLVQYMASVTGGNDVPFERVVYLDLNFAALTAAGIPAYGTFQTAYDAANAMSVAGGGVNVALVVNTVNSLEAGALNLTANYNPNVVIIGFGEAISQLGSITSNGFTIDITSYHVTFV